MTETHRKTSLPSEGPVSSSLLTREWLVTNGLGGYASGTISGLLTRRYHGLLIAALPNPLGRTMMLCGCLETSAVGDLAPTPFGMDADALIKGTPSSGYLVDFELHLGLPVWRYDIAGAVIEKRLVLPHGTNTVHVIYRLLSGTATTLELTPLFAFRGHDCPVQTVSALQHTTVETEWGHEFRGPNVPPLRVRISAESMDAKERVQYLQDVFFEVEEERAYHSRGDIWSSLLFRSVLTPDHPVILTASTEGWDRLRNTNGETALVQELNRRRGLITQADPRTHGEVAAELVIAADQFLILPHARPADESLEVPEGADACSVVAGYHWFTEWTRDAMISLEGLMLLTGRHAEARHCLHLFSRYLRNGLMPNHFPEGDTIPLYNTVDATLWYFHSIDRYLRYTGDASLVEELLPILTEIVNYHREGTDFGIRVDPADGLLTQGEAGYALTWMDAVFEGWIVTPRRGKAVEINALWYNALMLLSGWLETAGRKTDAAELRGYAAKLKVTFNERFWYEDGGYLLDLLDGTLDEQRACRPNQLFAISLANPILEHFRWESVVRVVARDLLTPVGLRTLAPGDPAYKSRYLGDRRSRDGAYHQGSIWPWIIGPFIDAWLKVFPDDQNHAHAFLESFRSHLSEACVGSISEVFDAEAPFAPRACIAQAWSVAEVLRAFVATGESGGRLTAPVQ